ncbi:MAG: hypothetical protein ACERKK_06770 [Poseidonibacter sp.]|uniref:hypothetical protein n=1 Tax=Poseidonibacter sp. TaxID=2321188 RepID=UPI00359E9BB7
MSNEIRRLPKKTVIIIGILIASGLAIFMVLKTLKEEKMTEVLATLGHTNIKEVKVINRLSVEDKKTRYKSSVYKIMFYDNTLRQTCSGFVHRGKDNKYTKDLDCK